MSQTKSQEYSDKMVYILKDKDELIMTGKQLREFKEIIIKETMEENKE